MANVIRTLLEWAHRAILRWWNEGAIFKEERKEISKESHIVEVFFAISQISEL